MVEVVVMVVTGSDVVCDIHSMVGACLRLGRLVGTCRPRCLCVPCVSGRGSGAGERQGDGLLGRQGLGGRGWGARGRTECGLRTGERRRLVWGRVRARRRTHLLTTPYSGVSLRDISEVGLNELESDREWMAGMQLWWMDRAMLGWRKMLAH